MNHNGIDNKINQLDSLIAAAAAINDRICAIRELADRTDQRDWEMAEAIASDIAGDPILRNLVVSIHNITKEVNR